ncbi:RTA1 like protein [Stemphylium lycopersici]|nr:RTA1 like protein [Stemphylium lycopersici]
MSDGKGYEEYIFYRYTPTLAGAVIFVILFACTTIYHGWQAFRQRFWFMIPIIIGGIFETIGYIGRALSHSDKEALGPYVIQTLLLLLGPALFAASIYMILGRIILLTDGEKFSIIRRTWLTKIFVGGDVLSFFTQSGGGGIMSGADEDNPNNMKIGEKVIIVGLCIQVIFFGFFLVTAFIFQKRGREHLRVLDGTVPWRKHLYVLYGTSVLILVRSVFRVAEYAQGNDGFLLRHEAFLYVFDAVLMFIVMLWLNIVHPGEIAKALKDKEKAGSLDGEYDLDGTSHNDGSTYQPGGILETRTRSTGVEGCSC